MRYTSALVLLLSTLSSASAATSSNARLPAGIAQVVSDLDKPEVSTACLITSNSVTSGQKNAIVTSLVGTSDGKAIGTDDGVILAQPSDDEVAATAIACGGSVVYSPDAVDLARGEGLFVDLAPAMEAILTSGKGDSLLVVAPEGCSVDETQKMLEQSAKPILSSLVAESPVRVLEDVFAKVTYMSTASAAALKNNVSVESLQERVKNAASMGASAPLKLSSAANLAAARQFGPAARTYLQQAVQQVRQVCQDGAGSPALVVNFGELCDAAVQQAIKALQDSDATGLFSSQTGGQIRASLLSDMDRELSVFFQEQMEQLQLASFEEFKKGLSKLLISPNLGADMEALAGKSIAEFGKSAKKMAAKQCASFQVQPAKDEYRRKVKEYVKNRLLSAKASGQYKPLPRKGVTVGLHWLLPKPFGNDYRQEPWMVHATDNMVYIPKDKITDVSPEEVAAGDWRSKVVPSPVGNDMLYMQ